MDYHLISAPLDKIEYLFFAATLRHRGRFYKLAVAEHLNHLQAGYTNSYDVLIQSEGGTHALLLHCNEAGVWCSNNSYIHKEILFLIGAQIERIKQ